MVEDQNQKVGKLVVSEVDNEKVLPLVVRDDSNKGEKEVISQDDMWIWRRILKILLSWKIYPLRRLIV